MFIGKYMISKYDVCMRRYLSPNFEIDSKIFIKNLNLSSVTMHGVRCCQMNKSNLNLCMRFLDVPGPLNTSLQWRHVSIDMAPRITGNSIVSSIVCFQANNKENSKAPHWSKVRATHMWPVMRKAFPCHNVIILPDMLIQIWFSNHRAIKLSLVFQTPRVWFGIASHCVELWLTPSNLIKSGRGSHNPTATRHQRSFY